MPTDRDPRDPRDAEVADDYARAAQRAQDERDQLAAEMKVRAADLEPYVGLRYVAKLFRLIAILLLLSLVAAVIQNLYLDGPKALLGMIPELSQLLVLTGLLWGAGDLALLLIDVGHDVRATRILLGRQVAHHSQAHHPGAQLVTPAGDPAATAATAPAEAAAGERRSALRVEPGAGERRNRGS